MTDTAVPPDLRAIPAEIDRWNWGAFLLHWIWGIGNNTYIALLTFVPIFGLVWIFVLGAKGSAWAWRNGRWDSVAHFKRVQRLWAIWGVVIWIGVLVLGGSIVGGVFHMLKHSAAYEMAAAKVQTDPIAVNILGSPISTGFPFGKVSVNGAGGAAALSFSATGPKATATVLVEAIKKNGVWTIVRLGLQPKGSDHVIDLVNTSKRNTT